MRWGQLRKPKNEAARHKAHNSVSIDSLLRPNQKQLDAFNPNSLRSLACRTDQRRSRRSVAFAFCERVASSRVWNKTSSLATFDPRKLL
jgi:hypothetical protein